MRLTLISIAASCAAATALAGAPPKGSSPGTRPDAMRDDVSMEVYLETLARIAPAAREGAAAYLQAFERKCGRAMQTIELRRALAEGPGDTALMAMVRAAAQRDTTTLQHLSNTMPCLDRR